MIDNAEFERYQSYSRLQNEYKQMYQKLELQYESCRCFNCKAKLILFGLELLSLKSILDQMETQIVPRINVILENLQIEYVVSENGQTGIVK